MKICFKNNTELYDSHKEVYVTDFLKKVPSWPIGSSQSSRSGKPLSPSVPMATLYASPNGFATTLEQNGTDTNTWCITNQDGFNQIIQGYASQKSYTLSLSISLRSYSDCVDNDYYRQKAVEFQNNAHILTFRPGSARHGGESGGKSNMSKFCCYYGLVAVIVSAGVFGFYWFKMKDDSYGGFSKV